jgi:tRNA nucleotidyltransferase/poly(A) polymerase
MNAERLLDDPRLATLFAALARTGAETRIVGGAVRDALFGLPPHEIDLATTALPQEVLAAARTAGLKGVPTGIEHGTVTIVVAGAPFEVTTLREDVETDGRYAVVRFGGDFEQDARRRDFTVNALSLSPDGRLHDYTGGLKDIADRRIRFIGDAATRIREDYLRVLRFFRFNASHGEAGFDREGLHEAIVARENLSRLSRERIRAELIKLLPARRAGEIMRVMSQAGIIEVLLGMGYPARLERLAAFEAAQGKKGDAVLRLAAFSV